MERRLSDRVKQIFDLGKLQCKSLSKQVLAQIPEVSGDIKRRSPGEGKREPRGRRQEWHLSSKRISPLAETRGDAYQRRLDFY